MYINIIYKDIMELQVFTISAAVIGLIFGIIGFILGLYAVITVKALERSTHTITYKPIDEEIDKHNQELTSSWATSEEALNKDTKLYREDVEKEMPEFAHTEEEDKIYSF